MLLAVDSLSILFNHRSCQQPAVVPEFREVTEKEGFLGRMGKVPLGCRGSHGTLQELRRRISATISGWDCPLTFINPRIGFEQVAHVKLRMGSSNLIRIP